VVFVIIPRQMATVATAPDASDPDASDPDASDPAPG
jgi:hypothetical protein